MNSSKPSAVFDHLMSLDEARDNPAKAVPYIPIATGGFHTCTLDEVGEVHRSLRGRFAGGSRACLLLLTGQRRADVLRMGPQHVKDGWLRLRRRKSRHVGKAAKDVSQPVLPALPSMIDIED